MNEHRDHLKRMAIVAVLYITLAYVLYETYDAIRRAKARQVGWTVLFALLGFAIGAFWMYKHMTCETCQKRWKGFVRKQALRYVE